MLVFCILVYLYISATDAHPCRLSKAAESPALYYHSSDSGMRTANTWQAHRLPENTPGGFPIAVSRILCLILAKQFGIFSHFTVYYYSNHVTMISELFDGIEWFILFN